MADKLDEQLQANIRGDFELGWKLVTELEKERPQCNRCAFNRGWMLLQKGFLKKGFECINRGRWENVFGSPSLNNNKPIWALQNPTSHASKYILFRSEGGLGDEIANARFVTNIKEKSNANITISCSKSLMSVFSRIDGVDSVIERNFEHHIYYDSWVPAMSAVSCLDYEYEDLNGKSYLNSILDKKISNDNIKIGIRWSGNPSFEHEQYRKFDTFDFLDITKNFPNISFYSFQRDIDLVDLSIYKNVTDLAKLLCTWEDTLSYLNEMDLVITSCTSIAHASAALGKETWVIVPILSYYIWAYPGDKSYWYDSIKIFRQSSYNDWSNIFENIQNNLKLKFI